MNYDKQAHNRILREIVIYVLSIVSCWVVILTIYPWAAFVCMMANLLTVLVVKLTFELYPEIRKPEGEGYLNSFD